MKSEVRILVGDVIERLKGMKKKSIHTCITSPPYWNQRDYKVDGQIGLEPTPEDFITKMVEVFREVRRVLRDDGVIWINIGDSYASGGRKTNGPIDPATPQGRHRASKQDRNFRAPQPANVKAKDLLGIPWLLALALRNDGWYLRSSIIWEKKNAMVHSVKDRCMTNHEYVFMLSKSPTYFFDNTAIREKTGREMTWEEYIANTGTDWQAGKDRKNTDLEEGLGATSNKLCGGTHPDGAAKRTVWSVNTKGIKDGHFASFPFKLIEPMILSATSHAGCCSKCGTQWVRKLKRVRHPTRPATTSKMNKREAVNPTKEYGHRDPKRHVTETKTIGWKPGCDCKGAEEIPSTVLDIFGGSGTTACVALQKNRSAVLIELNPEYVEIMKRRIKRAQSKKGIGL